MYNLSFFIIVCFVGIPTEGIPRTREAENNIFVSKNRIRSNGTIEIEITIDDMVKKFISPSNYPSNFHSMMKTMKPFDEKLKSNLPIIGNAIHKEIILLFRKLGISFRGNVNTILPRDLFPRKSQNNLDNSLYNQLILFPNNLMEISQQLDAKLNKFYKDHNYRRQGYKKSIFQLPKINNHLESTNLKSIFAIYKLKHFVDGLDDCIDSKKSYFDIKTAAGSLFKYPPTDVAKIAQSRFRKPIPRNPMKPQSSITTFEAAVCHLLTNTSNEIFNNCLKETKRINLCVSRTLNRLPDSNDSLLRSSKKVIDSISNLHTGCQKNVSYKSFNIKCIKTHQNKHVSLDFEQKNVRSFKTKTGFGSYIFNDVNSLLQVYYRSLENKNKLQASSRNTGHAAKQYKNYSKSLKDFKNNLLDVALFSVNNIRLLTRTVEKSFVDTAAKVSKIDLRENLVTMKCLDLILQAIAKMILPNQTLQNQTKPVQEDQEFWDQIKKKKLSGNVVESKSNALRRLIDSMKRLTQMPIQIKKSATAMLANTFLLATIFYEGMAMLAMLIVALNRDKGNNYPPVISQEESDFSTTHSPIEKPPDESDEPESELESDSPMDYSNEEK